MGNTGRNGEDGDQWSGSGIWNSETDQKAKIRTRNRNVIEMKQGFLETRMEQGGSKVRVPVWGCTECNTHQDGILIWSPWRTALVT